jgi:hypothetical protein
MKSSDDDLGNRIGRALAEGSERVDVRVGMRLHEARRRALDAMPPAGSKWHWPGSDVLTMPGPTLRMVLAALALSLGLAGTYYWNLVKESQELEEIDSALLADDLSPNAYIDPGFRQWLERNSPGSVQE